MFGAKEEFVVLKVNNTFSDIMRCESHRDDLQAVLDRKQV